MKLNTGILLATQAFMLCQAVCPPGRHVSTVNSSECAGCGHGKYQSESSFTETDCKLCPGGKFQDQAVQASCKICGAGKFQEQAAQTGCKSCTAGTFSLAQAKQCSNCISQGDNKYQDSGQEPACKTCETCSTSNAQSGYGQQCLSLVLCKSQEPSIVFLTELRGTGFAGMLSQAQLVHAKDVLKVNLGLTSSNSAQMYLQSIKNSASRKLLIAQTRVYEAAIFEDIRYSGTLTDVENQIKNSLNSTNQAIDVRSFVAQNQVPTAARKETSDISAGVAIGIGIGATLLAALPTLATGAGPAYYGGKALGKFVGKRTKQKSPQLTTMAI